MERVISVNSLENEGDRIVRDAIAALFDDDMDATDIIKWKDIYEVARDGDRRVRARRQRDREHRAQAQLT